jgi:hypothetical protein
MSSDLTTLYWRDLISKKSHTTFSLEIKFFESISWPDYSSNRNINSKEQHCELRLVGRMGGKSLRLRYVGALSEEDNKIHVAEWGQIIRFAIARCTVKLS